MPPNRGERKGNLEMKKNNGFTLIEMLVVICIIGILVVALLSGYKHVMASAKRAQAVESVSNVVTALNHMLQTKGIWPGGLSTYANKDGNGVGCVGAVADIFASWGLMGINRNGSDKFGILDPWGRAVVRNKGVKGATEKTLVPSGGTIQDHVIYYGIDTDLDGIVEAKVCGETVKVRANAIAWCAGADGVLGSSYSKRSKDNSDNVYSWRRTQEVKDK